MSKQKVTKEAVNNLTAIPDFFEKLGKNCKWFVLLLLSALAAFLFRDFLSGKNVFLYKDIGSDTMNGIFPYISDITRQTKQSILPGWSFEYGMGGNLLSQMLRDPFDLIIYYNSEANIPYGLAVKELLKVIFGGFLFFLFLKETGIRNFAATVGAIMFSFCAFMIVGGGWFFFSFEGFTMALLLYGYERFVSRKQWIFYLLGVILIFVSMPVNIIWHGLFLFSYILLRQYKNHQVLFTKDFFNQLLQLALVTVAAIMLAGPFFLEVLNMLLNSPRGSGDDAYTKLLSSRPMFKTADSMEFGTEMMRFFSSDILGTGTAFKGYLNFLEAPMFYCGLPCLLLMPQVFGFLDKKTKRAFIIFIAVWCLPIIFPYFRNLFWLFTGDYYRGYSFFVSLVFMIFSVIALDKILSTGKINRITLIVTGVIAFILLSYPYFKDKSAVNDAISLFVKIFLVGYFILILFYLNKANRQVALFIFLGLLAIEVLFLSNFTVNNRSIVSSRELKEKVGFNDYSIEALNYIRSLEKENNFYRVEKNYQSSSAIHYCLNEGMIQNYKGTSCYNSFSPNNYIDYLRAYGVVEKGNETSSRWALGLINKPVLQSLNSVKYLLIKNWSNPLWHITHDSLAQFGDVKVLRNKYNVPFGYTSSNYITPEEFETLNFTQREYVSLQTAVVTEPHSLTKFNLKDTVAPSNFSLDAFKRGVDGLKTDTLILSSYSGKEMHGTIDCKKDELLCLSMPYDKGWQLTVDGKEHELVRVNSGMSGIYLSKGKHNIDMNYKLIKFRQGLILFAIGLVMVAGLILFRNKIFGLNKTTVA
ncbi:MAG: YfhO family protein [Bacteroidia bacterium]|nr:YfhO family protein [Bacteroidia bacterium]